MTDYSSRQEQRNDDDCIMADDDNTNGAAAGGGGGDDDDFDELFSFGNSPNRPAPASPIRDTDTDDDDIFGAAASATASAAASATASSPSSSARVTRPTPSKSAAAVPSVEQVLNMLPTTETVPPTPPTTTTKKATTTTTSTRAPPSSMPRVPILGDGDDDDGDEGAAVDAEDLVVVQSSPTVVVGGQRRDEGDDEDDFHVHDSGTRDFLDWLDDGGAAAPAVSSPPAASGATMTPGSPDSAGSDGLGGLLDTPQRGTAARIESSDDGGDHGEMRAVDSFDFEKEIWGSGEKREGGGTTSPGAAGASPSSPVSGTGGPSSPPEAAATTTSPAVPPPVVPLPPAVVDERRIMSITSEDDSGDDDGESGDMVTIPPPTATEDHSGSISSFEPISAPSTAPNSDNGQDVHGHHHQQQAPVMIFRGEAGPAPVPAQTAAILRSDSEAAESTGGDAAADAGEISPPPPPPPTAGIFRGTSTTDEEFRAILPTLNDDGDDEGDGGATMIPPAATATAPSSPTIAALSFSSLRQALDSSRSMPSHLRHFVSSSPSPGASAGSGRKQKCDVWDLSGEDRARLYVKLICRKTYREVEGSSLAGSYEEWAREGVLEAAEGRDGGECWAREEARRLTRDLSAGDVGTAEDFEADLRSMLLFYERSHRVTDFSGGGGGGGGGGGESPTPTPIPPPPLRIPGFIAPASAVLLWAVPSSPPVASVTLSRLATSSALMPLAALEPEEQLAAARSLHERFYLLCAYHLPLVVLHLDRHLPGWHWPFCGEMPEPDLVPVDGEEEGEGEKTDGGGGGGGDDLLLTEEGAEREEEEEGRHQQRQTTADDCRHPERNGLVPLCWFVSAFAGSSSIPPSSPPDGHGLGGDGGGDGPPPRTAAAAREWEGGLPPRYLSRLWDVLLLDSGDGPRRAGWCGARKFFLALAVLERHSHRMLLIRDRDELEKYLRNAVLLSGVGAAGGGGGGMDGPHGADGDDEEDSSLGVVVVGGGGDGDDDGDPGDRPRPADDEAEVRRHVAAWFEAASTLRESTPRSVLDQLRTAEDDAVHSVLLARQRRTDRLLRLKLEEEAREHLEAERRAEVRRRLVEYYRKYNPEKTEDAAMDRIMDVYEGRWDVLDAKLRKKYGTGYLDASFSPTTTPESSTPTGEQNTSASSSGDGDDNITGVAGTEAAATEGNEAGTAQPPQPLQVGRLKRNLSTEASKIFAMAKRIDLAQNSKRALLHTPRGLLASLSQDSSDEGGTSEDAPRVFAEGQQEQVAVQVLAEEIIPVICAKHMADQRGGAKIPSTTTTRLDEGTALRYFLIDSRPTGRLQSQGRLPTAVHISPESLLDPELIQTELDMFESLRGSVHICVMGEGISAIPKLYGYELRDSERRAAQEDDSRTGICALFFIKMGFPFVSILDGGFGAAHSWLSREAPSHSLQPAQVLVDYDENGSMWAKLERTHRLKSQGISPAIQDFVDTSMAKLTVGKSRIEKLAAENLDREGRQRVKESVSKLIQDVRTQSSRRSERNTGDDAVSENTGENVGNRFKIPIRRGFAGPRGSLPAKDKGTAVGPAEEPPLLGTEDAEESRDKSVADDASPPSSAQPPKSTTLRKNPFAGLGNKIAAQRALHAEHAKKTVATGDAAAEEKDSAKVDESRGQGDHPPARNRFGGIGAKLAMRRKVGTTTDDIVVGEQKEPTQFNEKPSDELTAVKKDADLENAGTHPSESVAPDPSASLGNNDNAEGSDPSPGVGILRRNPFGGLMNRPIRSIPENDGAGVSPAERSEADDIRLTRTDENVTSAAAGRAVVADMFKKNPFGRVGNRAPGQSGDGGGTDDGSNLKNRVDVLKANPFARFGSKGFKNSAEHEFSASEESISFETVGNDDIGSFAQPADGQAFSPNVKNTSLSGIGAVKDVSSKEMSKEKVSQGNVAQNISVQENVASDPPSDSSIALFPVQAPALASPAVGDMLDIPIGELSIEDDKTSDPSNA